MATLIKSIREEDLGDGGGGGSFLWNATFCDALAAAAAAVVAYWNENDPEAAAAIIDRSR